MVGSDLESYRMVLSHFPVLLSEFHYFSLVVLNLYSDSTVYSREMQLKFHSGEVVKLFT